MGDIPSLHATRKHRKQVSLDAHHTHGNKDSTGADSLSGDGHARAVDQPLLNEHLEHRRDAAHALKVFHHILPAGLEVGHEGNLVRDLSYTQHISHVFPSLFKIHRTRGKTARQV